MTASQVSIARASAATSVQSPLTCATDPGTWWGDSTRSKFTGRCPDSTSESTTCDPMNPEPPVTRTLELKCYLRALPCTPAATLRERERFVYPQPAAMSRDRRIATGILATTPTE